MNEVSLDKIVSLVVQEVVKELQKNGIKVVTVGGGSAGSAPQVQQGFRTKTERIDMSRFKTPILTENHLNRLHELTGEIIIPKGTVITPKAREMIRHKNIALKFE